MICVSLIYFSVMVYRSTYALTDAKLLEFQQFKKASHEGKSSLLMMRMSMDQVGVNTEVCGDNAQSSDMQCGYIEGGTDDLSQNGNVRNMTGVMCYQRQGNGYVIVGCKEESNDEIDIDEYDLSHVKTEPADSAIGEIPREATPTDNQGFSSEMENSNYHSSITHCYGYEPYMPWNQHLVKGVATHDITQDSREIEGQEPLGCMWCSKTFRSQLTYEKHMKSHNGNESFSCHICGKNFKYYGSLKPHLRIHTSDWRFACSFCHKR